MSSWAREAWAVFAKDVRTELRGRVALNTVGLFAITVLVAVAFTVGPYGIAADDRPTVLSALLWVVLFFSATAGLDRAFVKEEETHTAGMLRLAARPTSVLLGKLAFNLLVLYALMAVTVPLFAVLMGLPVPRPWALVGMLAAGGWALAATVTAVAAIIARATAKGALFAVLSLPLVLPLLVFAIEGTAALASGRDAAAASALRAVVSFGGVMTTVSIVLFPAVWSD